MPVADVRTVRTSSGAVAVQVVWRSRRGSRDIEHFGSAHSDAEVEVLKDPGFDGGSIFLGIGVDLPGCSFCCGSSIAANSAGAQEWSRWSARSPRCLRAR